MPRSRGIVPGMSDSVAPPYVPGPGTALVVVVFTVAAAAGTAWLAGGPAICGVPALAGLAAASLAVQWVAAVPAIRARTEHYYDLTGGLTYLLLTALTVGAAVRLEVASPRTTVLAAMITVWALRLSLFLFARVRRAGEDRRFREIKRSAPRFLIAWTLQGLWCFWTPLAAWILMLDSAAVSPGPLDFAGGALWAVGFAVEIVADAQKSRFRARPENAGRYIDTGLWAWSRHPNYCGEILLWCGVALMGCGVFRGGQWVGLISPVFVWALLRFGSGVPLLEEAADRRWGDEPGYREYKRRTPVLFF